MRSASLPQLFGCDVRRIHCVGVGGMGVGPLAIYLAQLGFVVTGEDDALSDDMQALLRREQIVVSALPLDCELVVYSSAIAKTHPVYAAAVARKLPLVRRGEMLAEVVRGKRLVAVCGSHGKTTTAAMLITALRHANFPAGYVLGGVFADDTPPARIGSNEWIVAEVDESDGTIDRFAPEITVAVNLDWDHPDYYRQMTDLESTFAALFARTRRAVLFSDACAMSARVINQSSRSKPAAVRDGATTVATAVPLTFGRTGDFRGEIAAESGERMTLRLGGKFANTDAMVRAHGDFNAANACAALAAAQLIGAAITPRALADYPGVRRRQTTLHATPDLTVIEDYAHHPAEIRALLASLRRRI
jgi:UDP-N-acetylmuramate-alanine ligase